jgi:AcrR family transcriptional regulator
MAEGREEILVTEVAQRAGVHPTTIYRRWGSAEQLVLDVAVARLEAEAPIPATGDLAADLYAYALHLRADIARPDGLGFLRTVLASVGTPTGELNGADILGRRGEGIQAMIDRAGANDTLTVLDVFERIIVPIYLRVMFHAEDALSDSALDALARRALRP